MCTLTWEIFSGGYELHFNRDESRARPKADLPELNIRSGVSIIAPRDPEAGGTWISVNQAGISLCLLNNYDAARHIKAKTSRGILVSSLSIAQDIAEVQKLFAPLDLTQYSAFDLFVFSPDQNPLQISWDGATCSKKQTTTSFASSSGFDTQEVIAGRNEQYLTKDSQPFADFHRSHSPSRSAYSVCMHRPDAKTQSYSRIRVNQSQCDFWYSDGPPCEARLNEPLSILRFDSTATQLAQ